MKESTHNLLVKAEEEYGPKATWQEKWVEDDLFVPYQAGEREDLCLEADDDGFLYPADLSWLYYDDGCCDMEIPRKCQLFKPNSMIVWMECNHPGRIYISDRASYDWSNYNGCAPCEITWSFAMAMITSGNGDGPWNLEVCDPLPESCRVEMETYACRKTP